MKGMIGSFGTVSLPPDIVIVLPAMMTPLVKGKADYEDCGKKLKRLPIMLFCSRMRKIQEVRMRHVLLVVIVLICAAFTFAEDKPATQPSDSDSQTVLSPG